MKKFSLRVKLSAAFVLVALFLFVLVGVFANLILEKQFKEYTVSKLKQTIDMTVASVTDIYEKWGETWDVTEIENVGMDALGEGLILRISDRNNTVIWDAQVHNNGMCTQILEQMAENMQLYDQNFQGGYTEETYPITLNGQTAGSVAVGYYGPYSYSETDIQFLASLNQFLLWAAAGSFAACLLFGAYMAKRLTTPIARVIQTAGEIAKGHFDSRITTKSSTKEIIQLTDSVNSLAEALSSQELLRRRLTADVAHELRTPLATLQSHMEAMIDGVWEPEKNRLTSCHEEILRISKLVGELETLSRYEGEGLMLQKERFDISQLLKRILTNFESDFKMKSIYASFDGREYWLDADKDKISQVFINLISNALKFTPEGGAVAINVAETPQGISVAVSDSGIGIPEEDVPHIFERFYRTDKSRSRDTGGSGIGLTIAKSIVEAHGGSISVESEVNKGSVFTVFLPNSGGSIQISG